MWSKTPSHSASYWESNTVNGKLGLTHAVSHCNDHYDFFKFILDHTMMDYSSECTNKQLLIVCKEVVLKI